MDRDNKIQTRQASELLDSRAESGALEALALLEQLTPLELEMHLTRSNAKANADPLLDAEMLRRFCTEPDEAVVWAFRAWRDQSPFFPAISDIRDLIKRYRHEEYELRRRREEKAEAERRRATGEMLDENDIAEIRQHFCEVAAGLNLSGPIAPRRYDLARDLSDQDDVRRGESSVVVNHTTAEWLVLRERALARVPESMANLEAQRAARVQESNAGA